jgi:DNA-binding NarL/FixJ family response regulator
MHCLIIDDHPITLLGLKILLEKSFPTWKISTTDEVCKAIKLIKSSVDDPVKLAIVDLEFTDGSGFDILDLPQVDQRFLYNSIVISATSDDSTIDLCKAKGAKDFLSKKSAFADIVTSIKKNILIKGPSELDDFPVKQHENLHFTKRQQEMMGLVVAGYSNKKIAEALDISYGTVKNYMFDLMRLMSVHSRFEMAARIRELDIKTLLVCPINPRSNQS